MVAWQSQCCGGDSLLAWVAKAAQEKRPFKYEREKGVWSGFERDFVTCSPYVSAFQQLYSDLKQVASLPNKPQLHWHLLGCKLSCQCVKDSYMGQNRDKLPWGSIRGEKSYGLLHRGGHLALWALLGLFSWGGVTASLIYFLLLWWTKYWFWPFCLLPQRSLRRPCPYVHLGTWRDFLASRWGMDQVLELLPAAEFRGNGKTLWPGLGIWQMMGMSLKPEAVGGQANSFWVQVWKQQKCRLSLRMEVLHGPVGHITLTSFWMRLSCLSIYIYPACSPSIAWLFGAWINPSRWRRADCITNFNPTVFSGQKQNSA